MTIKSNTCPYCGAPYTINADGCRDKCKGSQVHQQLVSAAADSDPGEDNEPKPLVWNEPKPLVWKELWDAMDQTPYPWVLTTQEMFEEMLNILPPRNMGAGAFLVGEPQRHNDQGEGVYACFAQVAGGSLYQARYMTNQEFERYKSIRL